jgi:hypothetical protein
MSNVRKQYTLEHETVKLHPNFNELTAKFYLQMFPINLTFLLYKKQDY